MKLNLVLSIQFMLKDRERDMPTMLPRSKYDYPFEVELPPELEPFSAIYAKAASEGDTAKYDAPKIVAKMWRKKVRSAYPEMFKIIDQDGKPVKFVVSDDSIIDAAMCMNIEDKINKFIESNADLIVERLKVPIPEETPTHYLASKFVKLDSWNIVADKEAEDGGDK